MRDIPTIDIMDFGNRPVTAVTNFRPDTVYHALYLIGKHIPVCRGKRREPDYDPVAYLSAWFTVVQAQISECSVEFGQQVFLEQTVIPQLRNQGFGFRRQLGARGFISGFDLNQP